jgi:hypothetical protein
MAAETTRALMCLGDWCRMGFIKDKDIKTVTVLAEVEDGTDIDEFDWDCTM